MKKSRKLKPATCPWAELPFVVDLPKAPRGKIRRRCFWHLSSADRNNSRLGSNYAIALVRYEAAQMAKGDYHPMLPSIVADMPREIRHAEISFLAMLGWAAARGVDYADQLNEFWENAQSSRQAA